MRAARKASISSLYSAGYLRKCSTCALCSNSLEKTGTPRLACIPAYPLWIFAMRLFPGFTFQSCGSALIRQPACRQEFRVIAIWSEVLCSSVVWRLSHLLQFEQIDLCRRYERIRLGAQVELGLDRRNHLPGLPDLCPDTSSSSRLQSMTAGTSAERMQAD